MTTPITIAGLPTIGTVTDTFVIPSENLGTTYGFTALSLKTYMSTLANLVVTGNISGTLTTANQPYVTGLGTLLGVTSSGQIVSTIATGTAPLSVQSTTLVANLYVARALSADSALGGVTSSTALTTLSGSDVAITGNIGNITSILNTVNSYPGTWGGTVSGIYQIPQLIVNAKGLITYAGNTALNLTTSAVTSLTGTANQVTVTGGGVGSLTLSLPSQLNVTNISAANVASTTLYDNSNRVLTSVTVTAGTGISGGGTVTGPTGTITLTNAGILSVSNGAGLSATTVSGAVTLTNTGVTALSAGSGIALTGSTGSITVSAVPTGNGYGARTVSSGAPSGGNDGDIWYQV